MNSIFTLLIIFLAQNLFANDCLDISGKYKAQIREALVHVNVTQDNCNQFVFNYTYPNGSEVKKTYTPDNEDKIVFDDGYREVKEKVELVEIVVGGRFTKKALKIIKTETNYIYEDTLIFTTHFYAEKSRKASSLVERRDAIDGKGKKRGRVYIGYAGESKP